MAIVVDVISQLENYVITKEALEVILVWCILNFITQTDEICSLLISTYLLLLRKSQTYMYEYGAY